MSPQNGFSSTDPVDVYIRPEREERGLWDSPATGLREKRLACDDVEKRATNKLA